MSTGSETLNGMVDIMMPLADEVVKHTLEEFRKKNSLKSSIPFMDIVVCRAFQMASHVAREDAEKRFNGEDTP